MADSEADVKDPILKDRYIDINEESDPRARGVDDSSGDEDRGPSSGAHISRPRRRRPQAPQTFELEAVVSYISDGLVVVLRRARLPIPDL